MQVPLLCDIKSLVIAVMKWLLNMELFPDCLYKLIPCNYPSFFSRVPVFLLQAVYLGFYFHFYIIRSDSNIYDILTYFFIFLGVTLHFVSWALRLSSQNQFNFPDEMIVPSH